MKLSRSDKLVEGAILVFLSLLSLACLYPFWNSVALSLNEGKDAMNGGIVLWPRKFSLENYTYVLNDARIYKAFGVSVLRTLVGTLLSLWLTSMFAYAMTKKALIGRKFYMILCVITMYFSGGLIPSYLLIRSLNLMDSFWVYIIPGLIGVFNMIIFRSFFSELPEALEESAKLDGCSNFGVYFRIIVPTSKAVFASLGLFTAVGHWNDWFSATLYINNTNLYPLQTLLNMIMQATTSREILLASSTANQAADFIKQSAVTSQSIVVTTMIVAALPVIVVYPFLQKYFVKGFMIGSVKG